MRYVEQLKVECYKFNNGHGMELRNITNATVERSSFISLTAFRDEEGPSQPLIVRC